MKFLFVLIVPILSSLNSIAQTDLLLGVGGVGVGIELEPESVVWPNDEKTLAIIPSVELRHFISQQFSLSSSYSTVKLREKLQSFFQLNLLFSDYESRLHLFEVGCSYHFVKNVSLGLKASYASNSNEVAFLSDVEGISSSSSEIDVFDYLIGYNAVVEYSLSSYFVNFKYRQFYHIDKQRGPSGIGVDFTSNNPNICLLELTLGYRFSLSRNNNREGCETNL